MSQPMQQAVNVCREVLSNVTPEQMQQPTPCASWDVAGLVNHIVGAQTFFTAGMEGVDRSQDDQPDWAAADFLASFDEASAKTVGAFGAEGAMEKVVKMPFGEFPAQAFLGMAMMDTFTHAWDLAKATGQDTNLAPELAEGLLAQAGQIVPDAFRGEDGAAPFGVQAECADDACPADQLAAFLGRQV